MEFFLGAFTAEWEQRRAALLHALSLGRQTSADEDERRRRGGAAANMAAGMKPGFRPRPAERGRFGDGGRHRSADRPMRLRFIGLASGGQPAVVKMASFGGGSRLGAMINYVSRHGDVVVENERGEQLRGRDQLSAVGGAWDHLMKNRAESRDIGLFHVSVAHDSGHGGDLRDRAREIVKRGLGDRAFAFAVSARPDGSGYDIDGITVLRSPGGERLTADEKATVIVQQRLDAGRATEGSASFRFTGYGNGTDYGSARLRSLVAAHKGEVCDEQGRAIGDGKRAGDLVQLEWRGQLHSRKPRDVMHLVLSARAGTNAAAFQDAARDFLGTQFAGHRYVFSLHDAASDPKAQATGGKRPHVHVHAIIAMRSDAGDRIETTIPAFRAWRLTMAEKARAHGIAMEMTDRRDRVSPPAYSRNQVRPMNTIGRTQHAGTSDAAQRRYDAKRADAERFPRTARSQAYVRVAQQQWQEIASMRLSRAEQDFVKAQLSRLEDRRAPSELRALAQGEQSNSGSQLRTQLGKLSELVWEGDDMRRMTRPEFEAYEKRVETALFQAERTISPAERKDFEEIATAARDHVNVRRELVALNEQRLHNEMAEPKERRSPDQHRDDEKQRWNDAVARHGFAAAEAANRVLLAIEQSRDAMERAEAGDRSPDKMAALRQELDSRLIQAAELGANGNGLIGEVAEVDEELNTVLQAVERQRHKANRESASASSERSEAARDPERSAPDGGSASQRRSTERQPTERQDAAAHREIGDSTRGDPIKQHVPRLEELQREADEQRAHDRDDRGER